VLTDTGIPVVVGMYCKENLLRKIPIS